MGSFLGELRCFFSTSLIVIATPLASVELRCDPTFGHLGQRPPFFFRHGNLVIEEMDREQRSRYAENPPHVPSLHLRAAPSEERVAAMKLPPFFIELDRIALGPPVRIQSSLAADARSIHFLQVAGDMPVLLRNSAQETPDLRSATTFALKASSNCQPVQDP